MAKKIVRARAPLRLGLAGGGTDVSPFCDIHGGQILNATIDMYAHCTICPSDSDKVEFSANDLSENTSVNINMPPSIEGRLNLHKGVYYRIMKDFNQGRLLPCTIETSSDAPAGSGLGSSSALVVAMIQAFVEWLNLPLGEYDIAHLAYEIERKDVGINGGKQDQYAATFGGFNFMEFYEKDRVIVNPLRIKQSIINELECSLVLYFTGISRDSAKIIDAQAKSIRDENKATLEAMFELKTEAVRIKEALLTGDLNAFARCFSAGWDAKKKTASVISNETIEKAFATALQSGAISGKVSGAGGGGFMMFIVNPTKKNQVVNSLKTLGGEILNCHFVNHGAQSWSL